VRVLLLSEAVADLEASVEFYLLNGTSAAGFFIDEVESCFSMKSQWPSRYPVFRSGVRVAMLQRYPHRIFYRLSPDQVVVLGIVHQERSDSVILSRIG
jgi:plasmid stabilization system protein ParE